MVDSETSCKVAWSTTPGPLTPRLHPPRRRRDGSLRVLLRSRDSVARASSPVCLPFHERPIEVRQVRAIERPHPRRHLTEECAVVAYQQHGSVEILERVFERLDVL